MHPQVDQYLADGCGRCPLYQTPQCKVNAYGDALKMLRRIVVDCGLSEDFKWKQPCYTYNGRNVLMLTAFKEFCCISFFKGALLKDPGRILKAPGKNSRAVRRIRFTNTRQIAATEEKIKGYIFEAIELEKAGLKIALNPEPEPWPKELTEYFGLDPDLKNAFEALTPGRQRGYILYFLAAKQSKTRQARIRKCAPGILQGRGMHDK